MDEARRRFTEAFRLLCAQYDVDAAVVLCAWRLTDGTHRVRMATAIQGHADEETRWMVAAKLLAKGTNATADILLGYSGRQDN